MRISIPPRIAVVFLVTLVALAASPALFALPPQCEFSCTCNSRCTQVCAIGNWVVTCDFDQTCQDYCFANAPAPAETVDLRSEETGACTRSPQPTSPALDPAPLPTEEFRSASAPLAKE